MVYSLYHAAIIAKDNKNLTNVHELKTIEKQINK